MLGLGLWLWGPLLWAQSAPVLPEVQLYHSVGSRNSSYTTLAGGMAIHLFDEVGGPSRYLHVLAVQVPNAGGQTRLSTFGPETDGRGVELGVHDQWTSPAGKAATLSVRHIEWEAAEEAPAAEKASLDALHMGWSWESGAADWIVWLFGLDITTLHLPHDRPTELQLALGFRSSF